MTMAKNLFNPESSFWSFIAKLFDVLALSLLFCVCSLPVVTLGPAAAALYDCSARCVRGGESGVYARFFRTFKNECKTGVLTTLLWLAVWAALYALYALTVTVANTGVPYMIVAKYAFLLLGLVPAGVTCWLFPLLSRFTLSFRQLNRAAFQVAMTHLPRTLLCVLIAGLCITACVLWLLPLVCLPCLMMLLFSLVMEPVMHKLAEHASA